MKKSDDAQTERKTAVYLAAKMHESAVLMTERRCAVIHVAMPQGGDPFVIAHGSAAELKILARAIKRELQGRKLSSAGLSEISTVDREEVK